jgi:hypothetical protein
VVHVPAHRRRQGSGPSTSRRKSKGRPYRRMQWRQQGTWSKLLEVRNWRLWSWKSLKGPDHFAALISLDGDVIRAPEDGNGTTLYWKVLAFSHEMSLPSVDTSIELCIEELTNQGCRNSHTTQKLQKWSFPKILAQAVNSVTMMPSTI